MQFLALVSLYFFPHTTECHCSSFNWYSRRNAILFMPHIQIQAIHIKSDICGSHCGILVPPSGPVDVYWPFRSNIWRRRNKVPPNHRKTYQPTWRHI